MNPDLLCKWLGLTGSCWPPDPYALLGLPPGETDLGRIERQVQERLARLRGYQLSHPEEATEGMNRLAQAFIVVSEASAQTAPRNGNAAVAPPPVRRPAQDDTAVGKDTKLDWQLAPPPVRTPAEGPEIPVGILDVAPPSLSPRERTDAERQTVQALAEEAEEARGGLRSVRAVRERAEQTRRLLHAWDRAGKYFANPKRKLARACEKGSLNRRLDELLEAAEGFPEFVGKPGKPGYRVVALAHLVMTPEMYDAMDLKQREQLAGDWALARKVLLAHRAFVFRRFKSLRRHSPVGRALHRLRRSFVTYRLRWVGAAALAVVVIALVAALLWM